MRVRVYDQKRNLFFKSEVYAIVNSGYYEKQLLFVPDGFDGYFKFFDYLDKTDDALPVLINTIIPQKPDSWIFKRAKSVNEILVPYQDRLPKNVRFFEFNGFPWLWEDIDTLVRLLNRESVPAQGNTFGGKLYSDILQPEWSFIETQKDANAFMEEVCGFHDSVIKELHYISGAFVDTDKSMKPVEDIRSILIQVQSQQCRNFAIEFQGVIALNLRPAADNYTGNIFDAALIVQDEIIFFSNSSMEHPDLTYEGTWITAYSLKWRYVE
jgi:hypothetical protein